MCDQLNHERVGGTGNTHNPSHHQVSSERYLANSYKTLGDALDIIERLAREKAALQAKVDDMPFTVAMYEEMSKRHKEIAEENRDLQAKVEELEHELNDARSNRMPT